MARQVRRISELPEAIDGVWTFFGAAMAVDIADDTLYIRGSTGWVAV